VILFELGGFSVNEIAALQDVPAGTVKSRLSRGRAQLAQNMQEREDNKILNPGTI
jgi:DNA-directed RNA polymerase specialized sigma24 family protein